MTGTYPRRRQATTAQDRRAWFLAFVMLAGTIALVVAVDPTAAPLVDFDLPIVALLAGFVAGEVVMIRLHFRTEAHEFNLVEAPLVFAMFTTSPAWIVVSCMTATALVRLARHQQPVKAAFNIGLAGVEASIAVAVARWIAPSGLSDVGPRLWTAALVGIGVAMIVSAALVHLVIVMSEGAQPEHRTIRTLVPSLTITAATVSVALGAFTIAVSNPLVGLLWIAPLGVMFLGYRAYLAHLEESGRLAFIVRFTTAMAAAHDAETSLATLLRHVCAELGAGAAEAIVFDGARSDPLVGGLSDGVFTLGHGAGRRPMHDVRRYAAGCSDGEIVPDTRAHPWLADYFVGAGFDDAIVVPLVHDGHPLGLLTVANRTCEVARWNPDDHELLVAVAHSTSVILHSGSLTKALGDAIDAGARLLDETRHDPLTNLVNRRGLETAVAAAAEEGHRVAAIYLDLNDFKAINDTYGHATGDAVLRTVGRRLDRMTRPGELAARVGGDEFVVLLSPAPDNATVLAIAGRLAGAIAEPISVGDIVVETSASVGVGSGQPGRTAESLFAQADAAMYRSKRAKPACADRVITLR